MGGISREDLNKEIWIILIFSVFCCSVMVGGGIVLFNFLKG